MFNGTVYSVHDEEGLQSTAKFDEQIIPLDIAPEQISWEQKEPEEMTIRELREYIHMLEMQDQPTSRHWCEIYMRIFIPMASFFFAMIAAAGLRFAEPYLFVCRYLSFAPEERIIILG